MKIYTWLCAGLFCTGVFGSAPGTEEYRKAMVMQEELQRTVYEMVNANHDVIKPLSTAEKEAKVTHLTTLASDYLEQLHASATAGFAPGQYLYAMRLKAENMMAKPPGTDRSKICDVVVN